MKLRGAIIEMPMKGSCLCGAVRYSADAEPVFCGHCHCLDCQKQSGCGHVTVVAVPDASMTVTGPTTSFGTPGSSGLMMERTFCSRCGTTLFSRPKSAAGMTFLRAGTLDDPSRITPGISIYTSRAVPWDPPNALLPAFPEMPPPH